MTDEEKAPPDGKPSVPPTADAAAPAAAQQGSSVAHSVAGILAGQAQFGPVFPVGALGFLPQPQQQQQLLLQLQAVQSPYPPPQHLKEYEAIQPGSWNRILTMVEQAHAAQIETAKTAQANMRIDAQRTHFLGAGVTVVAMIGATICALFGQPWVAGAFLSVPVMSVGKALIESTKASVNPPPVQSTQAAQKPQSPKTAHP